MLKDNQKTFRKDVEDYFFSVRQAPEFNLETETGKTLEKGHGRIEKREYYLTTDISWLDESKKWPGTLSGRDGALRGNVTRRNNS